MPNEKITDAQRKEIASKFMAGVLKAKIAEEYGITIGTVGRTCKKLQAVRPSPRPATISDVAKFASQARSILWALDDGSGSEHKIYYAWEARIAALSSEDGGGMNKNSAIIRASKEYPALKQLFREYDVRAFDPNPTSHPAVHHYGDRDVVSVECENIKQSYRENLNWAIQAAGATSRTGKQPESCPCDAAWYLYEQAIKDPKDFLGKVSQVEAKGDSESEDRRRGRLASERSLAEIDGMLAELEVQEEDESEEKDCEGEVYQPETPEEGSEEAGGRRQV